MSAVLHANKMHQLFAHYPVVMKHARTFGSTSVVVAAAAALADASLVDCRHAPSDFDPQSAVVYRDFITTTDEQALVQDIGARMKRRRYEKGHWDAVITDYKEVELIDPDVLSLTSQAAIEKVRQQLVDALYVNNGSIVQWLPCHAIDLKRNGQLKAHVDSIKFSGGVVAGLSLLSSSIMRLKPDDDGRTGTTDDDHFNDNDNNNNCTSPPRLEGWVDLHLPPLSLYVLSGVSRYSYSHELLPSGSIFEASNGTTVVVERDHRLSVIFRDAKQD